MLTLDADHEPTDLLNSFEATCTYAACLYTTHGHTTEAPRLRIIVPMKRDVTSDEYSAIACYFTDDIGPTLLQGSDTLCSALKDRITVHFVLGCDAFADTTASDTPPPWAEILILLADGYKCVSIGKTVTGLSGFNLHRTT